MSFSEILSGIFSPKQETKSFNAADLTSGWKPLGARNVSTTEDFARELPSLSYPAIEAISNDFATITLKLLKTTGKKDEEVALHPALTTLARPNAETSSYDLLKQYAMYLLVTGEVYWHVMPGKLRTKEIYTLSPLDLVRINYDTKGMPISYEFRIKKGEGMMEVRTFPAEEILAERNVNLVDLKRGFQPFKPVQESIDASEGAIAYNNKYFSNDATPGGILQVKSSLTPTQTDQIRSDWLSKFRGANKSFGFAVVNGEMHFETVGGSLKDMAFKDLMEVAEKRILANWRIPKTILGQSEDVNRATIEGAEYNYSKRVIKPMFDKFVSFLNMKFLPLFEQQINIEAYKWRFEYENPVMADVVALSEVATKGMAGKPFMSVNEARALVGLEPLQGEEYNQLPTTEAIETPVEEDPEKGLLKQAVKSLQEDLKAVSEYEQVEKMQREEIEKQHLEKALKREATVENKMAEFFAGQEKRIESALGVKAVGGNKWFNLSQEIEYLKTFIKPTMKKIAKAAWKDASVRIGVDMPVTEMQLQEIVDNVVDKFAIEVNENTAKEMNDLLTRAVKEGLSVDEVAKEVRKIFTGYKSSRAKAIARTETNAVVSESTIMNFEMAQRAGIFTEMEWLAVGDEKTRPEHGQADGQVVRVGQKFNVGGEMLAYPGDPTASAGNRINCRCAVIPKL
jgi:HK97 family phage portal protein